MLQGELLIHIPDVTAVDPVTPIQHASIEAGIRTLLVVPLRKDDRLLGYITANRREVRPFSDKQISLLQNFAAQAVIAMENARLLTETREALKQQTATAEVLQVINSSPGELAPVFDAILEKAHTLCDAAYGSLALYDGERFRAVAVNSVSEAFAGRLREGFSAVGNPAEALLHGAPFVHIPDMAEMDHPMAQMAVELTGVHTSLGVPLRKDNVLLGVITALRQEVRPFSDKQIALLQNFAAQAVIAMENARLLTETREALEQQTATAEVLQVINSSPGDLAPVFDAMLEKAIRLCEADFGLMLTVDGAAARIVAERNVPAPLMDFLTQYPPQIGSDTFFGRAALGRSILHTADMRGETAYGSGQPLTVTAVDLAGVRALLMAPLLKDDGVTGVFAIFRREVRPFSDKQIALLENFAAQAVIAMENARLITQLRQRTRDLQESLEYQTATSNVLQVISRSTFDLDAVMEAVVTSAIRLCRAEHAGIYRNQNGEYCWAGGDAPTSPYAARERELVLLPGTGTVVGRAALEGRAVQIEDAWTDPLYEAKDDAREGGVHTLLGVPLLREGLPIGVIGLARKRVELFTDKQIALVTTFADQAVIAMENARLLTETREALEQQTATAEVLQVINASPGDLGPVFDVMLEKALRLCSGAFGVLNVFDGQSFHGVAMRGVPPAFAEFRAGNPAGLGPGTAPARILAGENVVHNLDLMDEEPYRRGDPYRRAIVDLGGARSHLAVALRKDNALLGMLTVYRQEVKPFTDKQIALLQNFAAQAVIAMENARLLTETREALEQQTATAEVLQVINSSPGDLAPVFDSILEKAHSLYS